MTTIRNINIGNITIVNGGVSNKGMLAIGKAVAQRMGTVESTVAESTTPKAQAPKAQAPQAVAPKATPANKAPANKGCRKAFTGLLNARKLAFSTAYIKLQNNPVLNAGVMAIKSSFLNGYTSTADAAKAIQSLETKLVCEDLHRSCVAQKPEHPENGNVFPGVMFPNSNRKLDADVALYVSRKHCPVDCIMRETGACYAEFGHTRFQAKRADNRDDARFVETVPNYTDATAIHLFSKSHKMQLTSCETAYYRLLTAGDFAKPDTNQMDIEAVLRLAIATKRGIDIYNSVFPNRHVVTYGYTHCQSTVATDKVIRRLHDEYGITLNSSKETVEDANACVRAGIPVVQTSADIQGDIAKYRALGVKAMQCPNQTKGRTCTECGLCAKFDRTAVILFKPHGPRAKKLEEAIRNLTIPSLTI